MTQEQARNKISELIHKYQGMSENAKSGITEAGVVHQFLDQFLRALGWPVDDPERYKYELFIAGGRPDMTLMPETGGSLFVEAKRFGVIADLKRIKPSLSDIVTPGQMALPGMATDRTTEEQQAINYAFQNGATWAILTNFEKLRLFNARRDWMVLSFENPSAYLEEFDLLWQLSYESVLNGRLDELSNQRHREDVDTDYLNFINEWREKLAEDIVDHQTENWWAFDDDGRINLTELRAVVQRILDRLVVIRFAEDHLVIPPGTLQDFFELRKRNPYTFTLSEFFQRLYRRFDEHHNSALFAPGLADQAIFSDGVLAGLVQKLYEARYRAMSADIMGNTYEQYLGKTLVLRDGRVETADNLETRKKQGSYYTPQVIVRHLVDNSMGRYLYGTADGKPGGEPLEGESRKTAEDIKELHLIDPACGSGSFLIYAYDVLSGFYRGEIKRLEEEREDRRQELIESGITTPFDLRLELTPWTAEIDRLQEYPRIILENHLYGVDLDPQAAEIATVNLIMKAMADQPRKKKRLPLILNQNVKVGNSLIGAGPTDGRYEKFGADLADIRRLRLEIASKANGSDHDQLMKKINEYSTRVNEALDENLTRHFRAVTDHRPFNWAVEFPEIFLDEEGKHKGEAAGFDVVVGNPPWEIVKPDLREYYAQFDPEIESKLNRKQVEQRIEQLNALDPNIEKGWEAQKAKIVETAAYYRKTKDFVRQGRGDRATHKLFFERCYYLLRQTGRIGFIIPSGIYSDLGTRSLREMMLDEGCIDSLVGLSNVKGYFPAIDSRFKFTLLSAQKGVTPAEGFYVFFRIDLREGIALEMLPEFLADKDNYIYMTRNLLGRFSPVSHNVMEFQTQTDYSLAEKIYSDWPLVGEDESNIWIPEFAYEIHMSNDSHLFNQDQSGLQLYEGKMIHQFDPYFAKPRYWIEEVLGAKKTEKTKAVNWYKYFRFGFREIARATDVRTCIATVLPPNSFAGHTLWVGITPQNHTTLYFVALINSFCVDWVARFKVGTHVTLFVMKQLPIPRLNKGDRYFDAISNRAAKLICTTFEFADLWIDVMEEPWEGSKAAKNAFERQRLRDELDAIVAHLYGLTRQEFAHILGAFRLVFPDSDEGRAKREALLQVYDEFAEVFS